jgi:hypothetical protein
LTIIFGRSFFGRSQMVNVQWSMVNGQCSMVNGKNSFHRTATSAIAQPPAGNVVTLYRDSKHNTPSEQTRHVEVRNSTRQVA